MIGQLLGAYRVVREIGRGGMGSVWIGEHLELGHRVAIKVLLPHVGREPESVQRFFNEARAAARVRSPGIVSVVDFGRTAGGAPYLAMELLEGETLRARLRARGPLSVDDAATIARQVATTLEAAHAGGIVHRDLKPDNIMLVADPETTLGERPKILDFGIAKLTEDRWHASVQTRTGSLLGTPYYMSPEQCRGTGELDGRTDIYALGCILFELLCGRPPFVSDAAGELIGMHQFVAPPSPRSLRPELPEWLDEVVMRALAKPREERFASMAELAEALERGGAAAARARRVSGPHGEPFEVGLAETVATPSSEEHADTVVHTPDQVQVVAMAETTASDRPPDLAAITRDAQARAQAMAERLAREQVPTAGGRKGQWITVVAVAVVVLASLLIVVRTDRSATPQHAGMPEPAFERQPAEPSDPHAALSGSGSGVAIDSTNDSVRPRDTGMKKPERNTTTLFVPEERHDSGVPRDAGVPHARPPDAGAPSPPAELIERLDALIDAIDALRRQLQPR